MVLSVPSDWTRPATETFDPPSDQSKVSTTAYICHTSGTSSGLPKPIYQSHAGVVECLYPFPSVDGADPPATFSTTPLYHGGLPDALRSWSSSAMIWFFPEGHVPVTGSNVIRAVQTARNTNLASVMYFSSVPYVLQMLLDEESRGLELLQTMDLVGFGGAALPTASGDELVNKGVNLLSRMGSAECGFLMSSHRDYANEKEWDYLRPVDDTSLLKFEPRESGLSELTVRDKWPFKTTTNYENGKAYATSDLFEPHPSKPNTWRYHSRADALITLLNGKKFDPAPMEADILAAMARRKLLKDVLVFGTGKEHAGIILFPQPNISISNDDLITTAWKVIEEMNTRSQSHARIPRSAIIVVSPNEPPLPKSSKGTTLRSQAETLYHEDIDLAFLTKPQIHPAIPIPVPDHLLHQAVMDCFHSVLGREIDPEQDLYQQGVDSIACVQIRGMVESLCLKESDGRLPLNVIYDQCTVAGLREFLFCFRKGVDREQDETQKMQDMAMRYFVSKYGTFENLQVHHQLRGKRDNVVVLTGATGFLGSHILHLLRQDARISRIYCLVRAQSVEEAGERISAALSNYGRPSLRETSNTARDKCKVTCLASMLTDENLGFSQEHLQDITHEATLFIHLAWTVNFNLKLRSFEDQISGTRNLINAAARANARLYFISSTAAVSSSTLPIVPEIVSTDPSEASPLGYSQSKWVAEQICAAANEASRSSFVSVIRVGQLCGNEVGVWNTSEAYPLLLSTARATGCLPDLEGQEVINWMPVELAAMVVLEITGISGLENGAKAQGFTNSRSGAATPVYHALNPHNTPSWSSMLQWIRGANQGPVFEVVAPWTWVGRLEEALKKQEHSQHPSQALLSLWKKSFCDAEGAPATGEKTVSPSFDISRTQTASSTMMNMQPLDQERVQRIWEWIQHNIR